jgi:hypothetical protein
MLGEKTDTLWNSNNISLETSITDLEFFGILAPFMGKQWAALELLN